MSYFDEEDRRYAYEGPRLKHSRWGIASFIICLGVACGDFMVVAAIALAEAANPGGIKDDSPIVMGVGFLIIALFFVNIIGVILGVIGLCERRRNKVFAILGTIIGVLAILGICGLMAVGIASKNAFAHLTTSFQATTVQVNESHP